MTDPFEYDGNTYLEYVLRKWGIYIVAITLAVGGPWYISDGSSALPIAKFIFRKQDILLLPVMILCWFYSHPLTKSMALLAHDKLCICAEYLNANKLIFILIAACMGIVCYLGHYILLGGYANSRDEQMAVFDSYIFASGHLVAPIDIAWRAFAPALNQMYMIPIGNQEAWVSSYLPVNAAFRALFATLGDAALTSPFFVAIGAVAIWRVTKQLWPERRDLPILSLILYAGSGQVIFNGMTSYAMSGHLALNLVWLSLFLMDKKRYDVAALAVGFLATGLHQPVFHPLFAAPILTLLVLQKNWSRACVYLIGYGAICAFWLYWPVFISSLTINQNIGTAVTSDYATRTASELHRLADGAWLLMPLNLLRFVAWQHALLMPLSGIGIMAAYRNRNEGNNALFIALFASILLHMFTMTILVPNQGLGLGYRYMHGVVGNGILLAVLGWQSIKSVTLKYPLLLTSTMITFFLVLPIQAYMTHKLYMAYVDIDHKMTRSKVDTILVDTSGSIFAQDLVFNLPTLKERPVRIVADMITNKKISALCANNKTITIVQSQHMKALQNYWNEDDTGNPKLVTSRLAAAKAAGCNVIPL